ncbi:hypothetical protein DF947_04640 [Pedobacter paludis]|uniref:Uncharacterized protein n=1 Tax=Pedobacter paludis TaxID=2203212 RepID=A0A317F4G4_9SPHI|nr:hypothetical protein DF947_04640 [Pedobacter paludis]
MTKDHSCSICSEGHIEFKDKEGFVNLQIMKFYTPFKRLRSNLYAFVGLALIIARHQAMTIGYLKTKKRYPI